METSIIIEGLSIFARHGVEVQERMVGNEFEIDLTLVFGASRAMLSDAVEYTISYADVIEDIKEVMCQRSDLLEHVAGRIVEMIKKKYPTVKSGILVLYKVHPPVSAQLRRVGFKVSW